MPLPIFNADVLGSPAGQVLSGMAIQTIQVSSAAYAAIGSPYMNLADTLPASTDGTQLFSQAITLAAAANKVRIDVSIPTIGNSLANAWTIGAIFRGSTCIDAGWWCCPANNLGSSFSMVVLDAPGATSVTYSFRIGPDSNPRVTYINGTSAARYMGGASAATFTLTEIKA